MGSISIQVPNIRHIYIINNNNNDYGREAMFYLCRKQVDDGKRHVSLRIQQYLSIASWTEGQQYYTGETCQRMWSNRPNSPYEAPAYGPLGKPL